MAVVVEGRTISHVAPDAEVVVLPGDWAVACGGRVLSPGLTDAHTRLVGGHLGPRRADHLLSTPAARTELNWRVARTLSAGEVEAISAWSLARGLRAGTTFFVEHLQAPAAVSEALGAQARMAQLLGARLVTSHASSSRDEALPGEAQVEGNAAFAAQWQGHALVRGMLGVQASSSVEDGLLHAVGGAREKLGVGVHFRLAESDDELATTWSRWGVREVQRFEAAGLLGAGSVAAHGKAIGRLEAQRLAKSRTAIALCLRAGGTESLGSASMGLEAALAERCLVGLGTDGTGSLWTEVAVAQSALLSLARGRHTTDPDENLGGMLFSGAAELCTMIFGLPSGAVEVGALADLVLFDHVPSGEAQELPYLLMQLAQSAAAWTIVDGRVVVREGQLVGHDYPELAREAARAIDAAWRRAETSSA